MKAASILWAKEVFGDFHGFLSGWCYWTNNMLYVPTVMLYFVGVSVFALGPAITALADNKTFAMVTSVALLALLTVLNIVGLGVGKWLNNVGAIGTFVAAAVLIGLGIADLVAFWHHRDGRRFPHSRRSRVCAEFFRRNLLSAWLGWNSPRSWAMRSAIRNRRCPVRSRGEASSPACCTSARR